MTATPEGGPSFGYVQNSGSGAIVGTLTWTTTQWQTPNQTPVQGQEQNDCVCALPLDIAGDHLQRIRVDPTGLYAECRVSYPNGWIDQIHPACVPTGRRPFPSDADGNRQHPPGR